MILLQECDVCEYDLVYDLEQGLTQGRHKKSDPNPDYLVNRYNPAMILIQECDVCGYEYDLDQGLDGHKKVIQIRNIQLTDTILQ